MSKTRLKLEIANFEEVLTREITPNGTGAHISLPREHLGEKVKIIIMKKEK